MPSLACRDFEILSNYREKQKKNLAEISLWLAETLLTIEYNFGISDLTVIELFDLRRDMEHVLRRNLELASDFNESNAKERLWAIDANIMRYPIGEVINIFLTRYGLHSRGGPKFVTWKEKESYLEYLKGQLHLARQEAFIPIRTK